MTAIPEALQYTARPDLKRIIIPEVLKTLILCLVFFAGVVAMIVSLRMTPHKLTYPGVGVLLVILFIVQIILTVVKMKKVRYEYYPTNIKILDDKPKTILLREIEEVTLKTNAIDKIFKTATIQLGTKGHLDYLKNTSQSFPYTQKLVAMSKR